MFDFLFQKRIKRCSLWQRLLRLTWKKLNLSKLAIEKAVMMIARAIAKSDIIVQTKKKLITDSMYSKNKRFGIFFEKIIKKCYGTEELIFPKKK